MNKYCILMISLSIILTLCGVYYFSGSTHVNTFNVEEYECKIDSLNKIDSILTSRENVVKSKEADLAIYFDSLNSINKSKYEKNIINIDTLSTDELIRIFTIEISNEVENW